MPLPCLTTLKHKLEKHGGNLIRSAVELAKDWRTDRTLRRLEAMLIVADKTASFIITGTGDVLEPEHGVLAIVRWQLCPCCGTCFI